MRKKALKKQFFCTAFYTILWRIITFLSAFFLIPASIITYYQKVPSHCVAILVAKNLSQVFLKDIAERVIKKNAKKD